VGQDEGLVLHGAIEADEKMVADLAGPGYHINRSNLLVLESKADMQKRGQASPDDGDALALTFAQPVEPVEVEEEEEEEGFGRYSGRSSGSGWMR
jgi:phage terminase large subunit